MPKAAVYQSSDDKLNQSEIINPEINLSINKNSNAFAKNLEFQFSGKKINTNLVSRNNVIITVDKKIILSNGIKSPIYTKNENNLSFTSDWIFIGLKSEIEINKNAGVTFSI